MSMPETVTLELRTFTTECGVFAVLSEQEFDGRKFLALLPPDDVGPFLEGKLSDGPGPDPELVEVRDGLLFPMTVADQDRFFDLLRQKASELIPQGDR